MFSWRCGPLFVGVSIFRDFGENEKLLSCMFIFYNLGMFFPLILCLKFNQEHWMSCDNCVLFLGTTYTLYMFFLEIPPVQSWRIPSMGSGDKAG